jgi:ubiquinone/menaquinone biosynthesis C-methylase UbiE
MPDVYARISEADRALQERLADVIELRAAEPRYAAIVRAHLERIPLPAGARLVEIGCGTGSVTRSIARRAEVAEAVGIDPCPVFIERARDLAGDLAHLRFADGDGRALPLPDASFDTALIHTTLSHVPGPEQLIAEARRVLRPGGTLAVFDGDYATATVALAPGDPLQACVGAFLTQYVHDPWLVRRLPRLVQAAGFELVAVESHGYVEAPAATYMLTWVDRGADALLQAGTIDADTAEAFHREARARSARGSWFGHIAFGSVLARRPDA